MLSFTRRYLAHILNAHLWLKQKKLALPVSFNTIWVQLLNYTWNLRGKYLQKLLWTFSDTKIIFTMLVDRSHLYKKYIDEMTSYTSGKSNAWKVIYLFLFICKVFSCKNFMLYLDIHNIYSMTRYVSVLWSDREVTNNFQNRKVLWCILVISSYGCKAEESGVWD